MSEDTLLPDIPLPLRRFEVTITAPRGDGGEIAVSPHSRLLGVSAAYTAEMAQAWVTVDAPRGSLALAVAEGLVPELANALGAVAEVRPVRA